MDDRVRVAQLLGREPQGAFDVVVRDDNGDPIVLCNAPFLDDGTPMPTRYYLVGADLVRSVSRIEAGGGVRQAELEIEAADIANTHARYAAERDAAIDDGHVGPRPYGGVGGTRTGVKCLHAHVAHHLAGGDDPVGRWTLAQLEPQPANPHPANPHPGNPQAANPQAANPQAGGLTAHLTDHATHITMTGGASFTVPIGPLTLVDGPLERANRPTPTQLTNALGLVHDHLDDIIILAPSITAAPSVVATGAHAIALARVEIGTSDVPVGYELHRADADEVFRTLAVETIDERRHNPGLESSDVESIIGTCCVILGLMRRLDLSSIAIDAGAR